MITKHSTHLALHNDTDLPDYMSKGNRKLLAASYFKVPFIVVGAICKPYCQFYLFVYLLFVIRPEYVTLVGLELAMRFSWPELAVILLYLSRRFWLGVQDKTVILPLDSFSAHLTYLKRLKRLA